MRSYSNRVLIALSSISGGLMKVRVHIITILADTAIRAGDLDEGSAKAAKEKAEHDLQDKEAGMDTPQLKRSWPKQWPSWRRLNDFAKPLSAAVSV